MLGPNELYSVLYHNGYFFLLLASTVEGPVANVIGGVLAGLKYFNFYLVFLICLAGDLIGDFFYYSVGYYGKAPFIDKYGKYFGVHAKRVESMTQYFTKNRAKVLIIGKLSYGITTPILIAAGLAKIKLYDFFKYSILISAPKVLLLIFLGYHFRLAYESVLQDFKFIWLALSILIILVIIVYYFTRFLSDYLKNKL